MPEKIEELVCAALAAAQEAGDLSAFELDDCAIERPADTSHGEWTSTMALKSAKLAHCAPRKIAEAVVAHMPGGSRDREGRDRRPWLHQLLPFRRCQECHLRRGPQEGHGLR